MIKYTYDNNTRVGGFEVDENGSIQRDETLETSVLLSLLSTRSEWAFSNTYEVGSFGSGLPNSLMEKSTAESIQRAEDRARAGLQWLLDSGVAESVSVDISRFGRGQPIVSGGENLYSGDVLNVRVEIVRIGENSPWTNVWRITADAAS